MVEGARSDSAAMPASSTPKQGAAACPSSANNHSPSFHESSTAESTSTPTNSAMPATVNNVVQKEKRTSANTQPVGVAHPSITPSSNLIPGKGVSSKSDAAVSQQKKSLLSVQEISNLVRQAPPPVKVLPVSNVHPLPRQFHQPTDYRSRKSSSANPYHRKGSTANGQKQRSASVSANVYTNGPHGRNKHGKRRNSCAYPEETHPFGPFQNMLPLVSRINGPPCPQNISDGLMPNPAFMYNFPEANNDFSRPQTQRNCQGMPGANFGYLQPVPSWTRDNNRNVPMEIKKQQSGKGSHKRRQGVSGMDQTVRNRTYGTSLDENDFFPNFSNNRDSYVHNPTGHNATTQANDSYLNPNSRHDHRYPTDRLPYDSLTDDFQQQCRLKDDFAQNTSNPASSNGHQIPHSDKQKARHSSMSAYQTYKEVTSHAYDDVGMRRGSCSQDKNNFPRGLLFFDAPEKNITYLTRKQVGYGRQNAFLPSSTSNPRFNSEQNSYEYNQNCHPLDQNEYKNRNMRIKEQDRYLPHNHMHTIDERIKSDSYHKSSANCPSCSHPLQCDRISDRPFCEFDHERGFSKDSIQGKARTRDMTQNKEPPSIESNSSQSSKSSDSRISNLPTQESKYDYLIPSLQAKPNPSKSSDARNSTSSSNLPPKRDKTEERPENKNCSAGRREHKRSTQAKPSKTSTSDAQTSSLGLEIEEEMARARNMDIPVKFDSTETVNDITLDPSADMFVPMCRDANGNMFKIVNSKGMSFFHPQMQNTSNNSNYLIPVQFNGSEEGLAATTTSMNSELPPQVVNQKTIDQSAGNIVPPTLCETLMSYPPQSNENSDINTPNASIGTVQQMFSAPNYSPAAGIYINGNLQTCTPSPNLVFSNCDFSNASSMLPVGAERAQDTKPNVVPESWMMNSNLTSDYQNFPPPPPGGPFPFMNSYLPPQIQNPTYETPFGPNPTVAMQMPGLPPDLNSPHQIQMGSPLEATPPFGNYIAIQNQGVSQPILVNQPPPQFSQVPISPFIQTTDYNQSPIYVNSSTTNSPVLYALNQMTPSPLAIFPANAIPSTLPSSENQQQFSSAPLQAATDNSSLVSQQSQKQRPIMNLQKQYSELMDNYSPFDSNGDVTQGGETSFRVEMKHSDIGTNEYCGQKVNGKKINPKLIREVLEKIIVTVNRTQEKSCEHLSSKQLTDILCGKSEQILDEIKTKHTKDKNSNYNEKPNTPETDTKHHNCSEIMSIGKQYENVPEDNNSSSDHRQGQPTSNDNEDTINAYTSELTFPPDSANSCVNVHNVNSAFPIPFEFEQVVIEGNSSNAQTVGHRRESDSGESGIVLTPSPAGGSQFSNRTEIVNSHLQIQESERRDSIGNVSVENRINFFEQNKVMTPPSS